jgi:crotonobetainyl-CoA:carnitine CoA-transferase CaiB-like acyl-CoA transferase
VQVLPHWSPAQDNDVMTEPLARHSTAPLAGVRVLELARVLAGPWCGQLLADLGADVIKVERTGGGDDTREWGPPFAQGEDGTNLGAAYYHSCNRGKRDIAADFTKAEDVALVQRLANCADVVIENFKVGSLAKYHLDHASLKAINPKLVYCSITGFGQTGPYASLAGYDFMVQGMGGIMDMTGDPAGDPTKIGVAIVDIVTGIYATVAVLAALRKRDTTGEGSHIDMALLDTTVALLQNHAMNHLIGGISPTRVGNAHINIVPYQVMPVADGHVIVAVGNDGQYRHFCDVLGLSELGQDPRFADNGSRVRHRDILVPMLTERTAAFSKNDLMAKLNAAGVPVGPINSVADVFKDPQVLARGLRLDLPCEGAKGGTLPSVPSPIVIDGERQVARRASPAIDEHRAAILADPHWGGRP